MSHKETLRNGREVDVEDGYRLFYCDNGHTYECKASCCLFCDHCDDIFYDYTNGPYMWICDLEKDTEAGAKGECGYFKEEDP